MLLFVSAKLQGLLQFFIICIFSDILFSTNESEGDYHILAYKNTTGCVKDVVTKHNFGVRDHR